MLKRMERIAKAGRRFDTRRAEARADELATGAAEPSLVAAG